MSDVASLAASATQMSQQNVREQAQIAVLKQSIDMAGQGALQLLEGVTETAVATTGATPSDNIGSMVDVRA
ncbi:MULTISPECIES: YjfB family protein [Marinobacter]|uniref:YjfB family protein n=1 Tax=Marinobacter TaxID=2742 RepID=UPI0029432F4A|nr:YjfB family protein [Marinobacter salarius]WOI19994.1 YjfB family protein [Marinobacter salarius]|tara:strand:- start:214 stop:426 length:213 start_codon:yes stop_codon:yes gene_type:complete